MEIVEIMNIFHWETTIFHNQHFLVNSEYHRDILYGYNEHIYIYIMRIRRNMPFWMTKK